MGRRLRYSDIVNIDFRGLLPVMLVKSVAKTQIRSCCTSLRGGEPYLGRQVLLFQRFPLRRKCDKVLRGNGAFLGHSSPEVIDPT